jgi:Ca-activated chloride channel homolog
MARTLLPRLMAFLWPKMLWLLAAVPALGALYILLLERRKEVAGRYPGLAGNASTSARRWLRHLPPLVFLLGIVLLLVAAARPVTRVAVPAAQETVVLAIDVSVSMLA